MKKKVGFFGIFAAVVLGFYLTVPACGNKNNNSTPYNNGYGAYGVPGYGVNNLNGINGINGLNGINGVGLNNGLICQPGQVCNSNVNGMGTGVPILNAPAFGTPDAMGSVVELVFGGASVMAGNVYNGPVSITGVLQQISFGQCASGNYRIQGQGTWAGGYGGSMGMVSGTLQMQQVNNPSYTIQAQLNGVMVKAGQDPNLNVSTNYYLQGNFAMSCNPGAVLQ